MRSMSPRVLATVVALVVVCSGALTVWAGSVAEPPRPAQRPVTTVLFGDERVDEYAWLRERENPAVIAHLEAENAYTDAMLTHTAALQETLYDEMLSRIQETDLTVPVRDGDWLYYTRTEEGKDYEIYCRRAYPDGEERVYLDVNERAKGFAYYDITGTAISPDHRTLAFLEDTTGDDLSDLRFMDLTTGIVREEKVEGVSSFTVEFDGTGSAVYYTRVDEARRPHQVWRHTLGTSAASDELVYEETDGRFRAGVGRKKEKIDRKSVV